MLSRTPAGRGAGDGDEGCVEVGEGLEVGVGCAGFEETEEAVEAVESGGEGDVGDGGGLVGGDLLKKVEVGVGVQVGVRQGEEGCVSCLLGGGEV